MEHFDAGDGVQTPLGKGTVREVRNNGRIAVDVRGRTMVFAAAEISSLEEPPRRAGRATGTPRPMEAAPGSTRGAAGSAGGASEIDLHGLTVEQALARVDEALNDALLADAAELRFVHGRSGGRIRAALHRHLREIPTVRSFRVDPRNEGVTIVSL